MLSTAVGAFIPIIPFFFLTGITAIIVAAIISLMAHFLVGAAKTLVTGRSWVSSGMEMTVVGAVEAVITYMLGPLSGQYNGSKAVGWFSPCKFWQHVSLT